MAASKRSPVDQSYEPWPVSWSAIWVGALAAIAMVLILGLLGISVGAYRVGSGARIVSWHEFRLPALIFSVCGGFFSFVLGGWAAGRILGAPRAESAVLHGALAWLVAIPLLLVLGALGAASFFGVWYSGLVGSPVWAAGGVAVIDPHAAVAARNGAMGALAALLLGLVGAVIGGWLASGEPMTLTYYRTRAALASGHAE
jgi:hypothetical protein